MESGFSTKYKSSVGPVDEQDGEPQGFYSSREK